MNAPAHEIILHHYDGSPYSEKIRLLLGMKGLAWRSVQIPVIMPKPDLMPLTGGYRRTPVMQIGADVYCDTRIIIREIRRRHPEDGLDTDPGLEWMIGAWADRILFPLTTAMIFACLADAVPTAFIRDREALMGRRFDPAAMRQSLPRRREQWAVQLGWLAEQLSDRRPFLRGKAPGVADIHASMNLWFARNSIMLGRPDSLKESYPGADILEPLTTVTAWLDRLSGIGHGRRRELSSLEALRVAREVSPEPPSGAFSCGFRPGERVNVMPDDYGRDPVSGELVSCSFHEVAIRREDPRVGEVVVHFPRAGFVVNRE
ncbi:MAG TPA: glutathione S-transferase family protein [Gammaproteobacteria bacterium]|nr:glutathione S-transferase family protein [Gammaproteobacteria bacterium]